MDRDAFMEATMIDAKPGLCSHSGELLLVAIFAIVFGSLLGWFLADFGQWAAACLN